MRREDHTSKIYPCTLPPCKPTVWRCKIQNHYREVHYKHPIVKNIAALDDVEHDDSKSADEKLEAKTQRIILQTQILHSNMHTHNKQVLTAGKGWLCPVSLPKQADLVLPRDYIFCAKCEGLYTKKNISLHVLQRCKLRDSDEIANRATLYMSATKTADVRLKNVSSAVRLMVSQLRKSSQITSAIKKDQLILYIGHIYLLRKNSDDSNAHIRERMRVLAKLVLRAGKGSLKELLLPRNYDLLCDTVLELFTPSEKQKTGYYIATALKLLRGIAIRESSAVLQKEIENTISLHTDEWNHRVGRLARMQLDKHQFQKVDILPISRDVLTISQHLQAEMTKIAADYENGEGSARAAKKAVALHIVFFNKRRGGEFTKITRVDMLEALARPEQEIGDAVDGLSSLERHLTETFRVIRVIGKLGKGVPVILSKQDLHIIDLITKDASTQGDKYFFQNARHLPYRSDHLFSVLTKTLTLERPAAIRYLLEFSMLINFRLIKFSFDQHQLNAVFN